MEKIYGMHKLVGLQLFWSGTPTFSSWTPTFCQVGVLNSCFQNPSESSAYKGNNIVTTLVQSFLDGSSSFLQVTSPTIKAWMSLNFGKIPSLTSELAALVRLKNH